MLTLDNPPEKWITPTPAIHTVRPTRLLHLTLLLLMLATPVLLSLLPGKAANYFLSASFGDRSYGLPAYCEAVTVTLTRCTPIGTLPLYAEDSDTSRLSIEAIATPLDGSSEFLECSAGTDSAFGCARFGSSGQEGG